MLNANLLLFSAVAWMARSFAFYFGGIVRIVFTVFQDLGPQVQRHSFKPKETSPFTLGIEA